MDEDKYKEIGAHLAAYLLAKRNARRSEVTLLWYKNHIGYWLRWLKTTGHVDDWLSPDTLDAYLEYERGRGLSDSSVKSCFDCVRAFLRWLKKRKRIKILLEDLPTAMIDVPQVKTTKPRQADYDDLQTLIGSIFEDNWLDYRDRCLLTLMLSSGLRVEEAARVKVSDINMKTGFVFVLAGKGGESRQVPFDEQFRQAFTAWILNRPATTTKMLFPKSDRWKHPLATGISAATIREMLKRRCLAAKISYINPHSVRHLFASKALNDGVQLSAVSAMLGHKSTAFTASVYARWVETGIREQYDKFWKVGGKSPPTVPKPA